MIAWSMQDRKGCSRKGQMTVEQMRKELLWFERQAVKTMKETGADHVLYGMKIFNRDNELVTVQFCILPMSDAEFRRLTKKINNVMVYALHKQP